MAAFSPRARPSPQRLAPRHPAACVDVQWKFLGPQPTQQTPFHESTQRVRLTDVYENAQTLEELHNEQTRLRTAKETAEMHDQRVLYDLLGETQRQALLDKVMAEMEGMALTPVRRIAIQKQHSRHKESPSAASPITRRASVLSAKMKPADVELLPQRRLSALGTRDEDDNDDWTSASVGGDSGDEDEAFRDGVDDIPELRLIRERHRRRLAGKQSTDSDLRSHLLQIRWQKSEQVRVALDLPPALLSGHDGEQDEEERSHRDPLSTLFSLAEGEQPRQHSSSKTPSPTGKRGDKTRHRTANCEQTVSQSPRPVDLQSPRARRVQRAHYGSWYVPRTEWWPLHQTEQDALREAYPDGQPPPVECHACERGSPKQRPSNEPAVLQPTHPHGWPSLLRTPSPVVSPRPSQTRASPTSSFLPSNVGSSFRSPRAASPSSLPPSTAAVGRRDHTTAHGHIDTMVAPDAITQRAAVLQQEIPQAYIAREYRSYLVARGARVPPYLNYEQLPNRKHCMISH